MFTIYTSLYAGTGVWRVPGALRILPFVGKVANVGEWYYAPLKQMAARLSGNVDVITLAGAGLIHHTSRHLLTTKVVGRKVAVLPAEHRRVIIGHSQGGLEGIEDLLDHHQEVAAVVLWSAPLKGSKWARFNLPTSGARSMAPGSRYLAELQKRQKALIGRYKMKRKQLPLVVLISAHRDGLVSCDSAFGLHPDWPEDRVKRICLSHDHVDHGEDVEIVRVAGWQDNHIGMVHSDAAINRVSEIVSAELLAWQFSTAV